MTAVLVRFTRSLAAGVGVLLLSATTVVVTSTSVSASAPQFGLVEESFNVEATGSIDITVQMPSGVPTPDGDFTLSLTAYRPVDTRVGVSDAINGDLPRSVDTVDVPGASVGRPAADQLEVTVPVEITGRTAPALLLARPGVYPVLVELTVAGEVVAELTTFVHRLPTEQEGLELPMPVAMAVTTDTPVALDDNGRVIITDATIRELTALADLLETSAIPIAVRVPPSLLTGLADAGPDAVALSARLSQAMQRNDLLSSPILPLDASAAAAVNQQALYTQWLRDGEDSLDAALAVPAQRSSALIDTPLSQAGGALLRNLGARLLVMPAQLFDGLPNSLGGFADNTQLVQIQVSPGVTVDSTIVDRTIARNLAKVTTTPELSAIYDVADLLTARQQVDDQGGDPRRHSITMGTPDLTIPPAVGFTAFSTLLAETPGLNATTLDDLSVRTDQLLLPEGPVVVDLPETVDGDISARMNLVNELGLRAASTGSMMPSDDPRIAEWTRLIDVLPTSALTDEQADGIATELHAQYDEILSSVQVPAKGFSFNLTDTSGTVPITLRNNADIPLTVVVRLSSSKLLFPDGDQTVELPPNQFTEVRIAIEARSKGDTPVTLNVLTPLGKVPITEPVALTASINALSGVGNLLTGAALLILFTWWVRHFRRNRRGRRAAEAANRHPVTRGGNGGPTSDTTSDMPTNTPTNTTDDDLDAGAGLSPDAATSTLPPS